MANGENGTDSEYDSGYCSSEDKETKEEKKIQKRKKSGEDSQKSKTPSKTASKKNVAPAPKKRKESSDSRHPFDRIQCNLDLSENHIVEKKIKISPSLIIMTKIVEVKEDDRSFSYPAIVFVKRIKEDEVFEYNLPLNLGRNILAALQEIVNA
jgi:hypothetical protein